MSRKPPPQFRVTFHAPDGQSMTEAEVREHLASPRALGVLGRLNRAALDVEAARDSETTGVARPETTERRTG